MSIHEWLLCNEIYKLPTLDNLLCTHKHLRNVFNVLEDRQMFEQTSEIILLNLNGHSYSNKHRMTIFYLWHHLSTENYHIFRFHYQLLLFNQHSHKHANNIDWKWKYHKPWLIENYSRDKVAVNESFSACDWSAVVALGVSTVFQCFHSIFWVEKISALPVLSLQ